jgi:hypothetical protein
MSENCCGKLKQNQLGRFIGVPPPDGCAKIHAFEHTQRPGCYGGPDTPSPPSSIPDVGCLGYRPVLQRRVIIGDTGRHDLRY